MSNIIDGVLEYQGSNLPFYLEDRILHLVGIPFQFKDVFLNTENIPEIRGVTSSNRLILFLDCCPIKRLAPFTSIFCVGGYIISSESNRQTWNFSYHRLQFYSEALDIFYSPQKAVSVDLDYENWNGEATIRLKSFEDSTLLFSFGNAQCAIDVARYFRINEEVNRVGTVSTYFTFIYEDAMSVETISDAYRKLYDFLSFVNYSRNIPLDDAVIYYRDSNGKFREAGKAVFFCERRQYEGTRYTSITADDIPSECLGEVFGRIASLRGSDGRLQYYFPKNKSERYQVDPEKWLVVALNFDGLFCQTYPGYKCSVNPKFQRVKSIILKSFEGIPDAEHLTRKERDYFDDFREEIVRYEGLLGEKFNHVMNEYQDALKSIIQDNCSRYGVPPGADYSRIYSRYRNKIAHGTIEPIGNEQVAVYRILQAMIYAMLLKGIRIDSQSLEHLINKLFL